MAKAKLKALAPTLLKCRHGERLDHHLAMAPGTACKCCGLFFSYTISPPDFCKDCRPLRLDLGCGPNKREGFVGVDALPFDGKVDVVLNLAEPDPIPLGEGIVVFKAWPWADGSVGEVHCSHFLEHLKAAERIHFFNELYRVMQKDAKALIIVPHWSSERAYGDPTHQWPPVVFFSFYYLSKAWREANAPHCGYECDFEAGGGNNIAAPWTARNQETQVFAQTHYINVSQDLVVTVTKR